MNTPMAHQKTASVTAHIKATTKCSQTDAINFMKTFPDS